MYQVKREAGRVAIFDWHGKIIYDVEDGAKVVYPSEGRTGPRVSEVKELTDKELLIALATCLKLPIE